MITFQAFATGKKGHMLKSLFIQSVALAVLLTLSANSQAETRINGKVVKEGNSLPANLLHPDPSDPANQFEKGELLIANPPSGFASQISGKGYKVIEHTKLDGLGISMMVIGLPRGKRVPQAIRELSIQFPGVAIDANHVFEGQAKGLTARAAMGWKNASSNCGRGVRLGVIDSGVDISHPALKGQNIKFASFHSKTRRPGPKVHGTAVATMLVGKSEWGGLLPGAQLYAASMFETKKDGSKVGSGKALLKALNWLAKSKVHAVNLSVAGTDNKILRMAFDGAKKTGIVLVAAAGNWGRSDKPAYPAAYNHVIAVTAVNAKKLIYSHANTGSYIDFAAPGVSILTAVPGGKEVMNGTSFASPYIAALIGAEIAFSGNRSTSAFKSALQRRALDLGKKGKDTIFGHGFIRLKPRCAAK